MGWIQVALAQEDRLMLDLVEPLREASRSGDATRTLQLVAEGADVNFVRTYAEKYPIICSIISCPDEGNEPPVLILAVSFGHINVVKVLLDVGADPNRGYPLHLAAARGHAEIARMLIDRGAEVNMIRPGSSFAPDGHTPLHLAILYERADVVDVLLNEGADLDIPNDEGDTPIDMLPAEASAIIQDIIESYTR